MVYQQPFYSQQIVKRWYFIEISLVSSRAIISCMIIWCVAWCISLFCIFIYGFLFLADKYNPFLKTVCSRHWSDSPGAVYAPLILLLIFSQQAHSLVIHTQTHTHESTIFADSAFINSSQQIIIIKPHFFPIFILISNLISSLTAERLSTIGWKWFGGLLTRLEDPCCSYQILTSGNLEPN